MTVIKQSDSDTASTLFYVAAVLTGVYGLGLLVYPQALFTLSGDPGVPANPGWVRWAGGLLLGMAITSWLAASDPESQRPLAVGLAASFTLIALSLLYSTLVGDYRGLELLSWLQISGSAALAASMWWLSSRWIHLDGESKTSDKT
jgi:hypothetical protein